MKTAWRVALLGATACVSAGPAQRPTIDSGPGQGGGQAPSTMTAVRPSFSSKKVNAKEDPNKLLAADRTHCIVSAEKYRETAIGESVFCAWTN